MTFLDATSLGLFPSSSGRTSNNSSTSELRRLACRIAISQCSSLKAHQRKRKITSKASLQKSHGLPRVDKANSQNQLQSVQQVKLSCTLLMPNGFTHIEICLCFLISGLMSSDGNLNTQLHLSERENFYGKKDTLHMPPKKMQTTLSLKSLRYMQRPTKNCWPFLLCEDVNLKMKGLQELTTQQQQKFMFQSVAEAFKVPLLTCSVKTSLRCSKCNLRTKMKRNNLYGRHRGDSQRDRLDQ